MEMTGLNPLTDKVLEIAIVPTDSELNTLDAGFSMVVRYPESIVGEMDEWCLDQHTKNGLINECLKAPNVLTEVEQLSIDLLHAVYRKRQSPLCGNSVFQDRAFMKHHMFGLYSIFITGLLTSARDRDSGDTQCACGSDRQSEWYRFGEIDGARLGFIAATASIAQRDVNFVLIPEIPFELKGAKGFLQTLKERIRHKKHAVIVVAEGAGQHLLSSLKRTDPSGNPKMGDIGVYLKNQINEFFTSEGIEINLKYIDPSYLIRSVPPNTGDNLFSATLAQNAVHAAMSGYTDAVLSLWHGVYCIIPSHLTTSGINRVTPEGRLWLNVLESTGSLILLADYRI
ncbi:hypothetical protein CHS0354_035291 [Potamilus streckersoni]|uniref:Phosphofructokinase n=1 Tax=Potamilus streckersoni TaxID=2493646 RepID=A0AAE0S2U2_9BIVA|nr:hypothetical protein CHS0354_035291 [Potamilus streckersoni]